MRLRSNRGMMALLGALALALAPACGGGGDAGEICDNLDDDDGDGDADCADADCAEASPCMASVCGDGLPTSGEECDDGNTTDGDACEADCTLPACRNGILDPGEECDDGNSLNADGCETDCTLPGCGNDIVDPGEECDDGDLDDGDACEADCTLPRCQNGIVDPGEGCDDGNDVDADGCEADCTLPGCQNGVVDPGEECDDGNAILGDGCNDLCGEERCGNGYREPPEECDDGGLEPNDGCDELCVAEFCGDGVVQDGLNEACDDGDLAGIDGCNAACQPATCGDGELGAPPVTAVEFSYLAYACEGSKQLSFAINGRWVGWSWTPGDCECEGASSFLIDDPAVLALLGSGDNELGAWVPSEVAVGWLVATLHHADSATDVILIDTTGGAATHDPTVCPTEYLATPVTAIASSTGAEACDDGNTRDGDSCSARCMISRCGDGNLDYGEECDDGNLVTEGVCGNDCRLPRCLDGFVDLGEVCDDGNSANGDGCDNNCRMTECGNGVVAGAEECDDGNTTGGDGCDACVLETAPAYVFDFSDPTGWTTDADWEIGPAVASSGGQPDYSEDPARDHTATGDEMLAGVVIGGHATIALHDSYYLTSPAITLPTQEYCLSYWRMLNSDYYPYMGNVVEYWDGTSWVELFAGASEPGFMDEAWTRQKFTVSGNDALQVRWGFWIGDLGVYTVASWSLDDVALTPGACAVACGDAVVDGGEGCDDGNDVDGDGCTATCVRESCGDGVVQPGIGETCDDGNPFDGDGCDHNCKPTGCGNGRATGDEQCDDGNTTSEDGCSATCGVEYCTDGVVQAGLDEECDDGNYVDGDGCDTNCRMTGCGNGMLTSDEGCDDGNVTNEDGCSAACIVETCGDGVIQAGLGEDCEDGNAEAGDGCDACVTERCGDSRVQAGETCDDGNPFDGDGCDTDCTPSCADSSGADGAIVDPSSGHCLAFFQSLVTWADAETACISLGGHLATIGSALEMNNGSGLIGGHSSWIGLNDVATEGTFVWSSGEALTYANWYGGAPSDSDANDCVMAGGPFFMDIPCSETLPYLCELP